MPSKTPAQQRLMGLALSIKRGKKNISSLPKGLQSKVRPLLRMTDNQLSDFAKTRFNEMNYTDAVGIHEFIMFYNKATTEEEEQMKHCMKNNNVECVKSLITRVTGMKMNKIKEIVTDIVNEILNENDDSNISDSKNIEVANFENYLKLPQNVGISFTQREKDATLIPNLPPPFAKSIFEIRYKSVEGVMSDGTEVKTNKTTVVKKIRVGETMMYKSFTLLEPSEEPKKDGSGEEIKEAEVPPTGQQPTTATPPQPTPTNPTKPQPKPEQKKQKVMEKTSQSFATTHGDVELFINFLKDVNEDIGL